jgi:hypothetical protein
MQPAATVVLIDGSAALLELGEQVLRDSGHRVLVTSDPLEALALTRTLRIDLVIADAAGLEPFRQQPHAPQLLEIGAAGESARSTALRRPFSLAQLQDAVALALGIGE